MKFKDLNNIINFNQDLINVFTDYAFGLDKYFSKEENKLKHSELYEEYQVLNHNLYFPFRAFKF